MSNNQLGCNQHRHAPGCWHPDAPHNLAKAGTGSVSPWGRYEPAGMDDELTVASHVCHRELYDTITRLEGKPAAPPSADDWDAVSTMPYPHQTTARLHLQAQELAMQRRADGTTPLPHGPGLSPDEARDARRQVLRDRLAYEQAEAKRQPEVQIDLMATA